METAVELRSLRTAAGSEIVLDPPVRAEDPLEDLKRRAAAALKVGYLQVMILSGERVLSGEGSIASALENEDPTELSVLVVPAAEVYKTHVNRAAEEVGFVKRLPVTFPSPADISVNMMPFILGKQESLPESLRSYWPLIERCRLQDEELGKVGFLTVQEGPVAAGFAQRRPGLHAEAPGVVMSKGRVISITAKWGYGGFQYGPKPRRRPSESEALPTLEDFLAEIGIDEDEEQEDLTRPSCYNGCVLQGGIYTASTVERSTRAWDMRFEKLDEIAGPLGDLEHIRDLLGPGQDFAANTLYWLTDATPHESVVLEESTYRQYFRLVTSEVSIWYAAHSTENPKGVRPDPSVTQIVSHDKFLDLSRQARLLSEVELKKDELWDLEEEQRGEGDEGQEIHARLERLSLKVK